MTHPDHPRPEVAALAEALVSRFRYGDPRMGDPSLVTSDAEHILSALPAPFAIVDMDALTERVARNMFSDPDIWREFPDDSQASWLAIPERQALYRAEARRLLGGGE